MVSEKWLNPKSQGNSRDGGNNEPWCNAGWDEDVIRCTGTPTSTFSCVNCMGVTDGSGVTVDYRPKPNIQCTLGAGPTARAAPSGKTCSAVRTPAV